MKSKKEIEALYKTTDKMIDKLKLRRKSKMKQDLLDSYRHIKYVLDWVLEK